MRKLLNKPWFVAILAIAAFVLCAASLMDSRKRGRGGNRAAAAQDQPIPFEEQEPENTDSGPKLSLRSILAKIEFPEKSFDPFGSKSKPAEKPTEPEAQPKQVKLATETVHVSAIWHQTDAKLALINGRIVQPGTEIDRLKVESIDSDGVWILHPEGREFLEIGSSTTFTLPQSGINTTTLAHHEG